MNITISTTDQVNASLSDTFTDTLDNATQYPALDPCLVAATNLWKFVSPLQILLGTFGNIMTVIVLSRKSMRKMTSSPYLVLLSLADMVVLYTGLLRQWLRHLFDLAIRLFSPVICKIHLFLVYTSVDFSVWILVALSLERFISVCFPFKAKTLCTRQRAMVTMLLILLALTLLNSHMFVGFGSQYDPDTSELISHCSYLYDEYETFSVDIWPWIDLSVFSMIPFCIILPCNISLIATLVHSRHFNNVTSSNAANEQRVTRMTALLVSLNTLFLVTTGPISIYLICFPDWILASIYDDRTEPVLWWSIVNQMMYLNNSVNFLFYCISGPKFRRKFKVMCGLQCNVSAAIRAPPSGLCTANSVIP